MEFLVDGHNAIHRLNLPGADVHALRAALVTRVRRHAPRGAQVVFDGHPQPGAFARTDDAGVEVRYAGDREADDEIVDAVRASRTVSRIVVVTDDLELARRVEQMGAQSVRVAKFFADDEDAAPDKPIPGGTFTAADFGLPEIVDMNDAVVPPTPRLLRPRGGAPRRRGSS